ncbi:putative pectinesterase [Helianthus annuus]|nr:putative pectinesterase [Helianthus annuus]
MVGIHVFFFRNAQKKDLLFIKMFSSRKKYIYLFSRKYYSCLTISTIFFFHNGNLTFSTFAVVTAPNFVAVNITIRNTAGAIKHQAVALRNGADLSTFYSCSFEGYQDTLYTHSLRQFYRECDIYGTVDFIFGNAAVVFQNCNLYPRQPMSGQFNAITAQGRTDPGQNTGTSIQNCNIRAAEDLGSTKTYLGRPWKEYSRTVYIKTFMDTLIDSAGWREWSGDFALNTSYYAEFDNSGPGSDTSGRVAWPGFHIINATDAVNFTASSFVMGDEFLPQTGVPYNGGL